jgi:hypothetical protein
MRFILRFVVIVALLFILLLQNINVWYWWGLALLLWAIVAFSLVGISFVGKGVQVFGKRADGTMSVFSRIILLPYLLFAWGIWWVKLLFIREATCHEIVPNLFLGRRPRTEKELPSQTQMVVDLTSEFSESKTICTSCTYRCLPMPDGYIPHDKAAFSNLVDEIAAFSGCVYVHCAVGRGRSALVVAAVLLRRGVVKTPDAAIDFVTQKRPVVRLNAEQRRFLESFL